MAGAVDDLGYESSTPRALRRILTSLGIRYEDFSFVDVGCGRGAPLLIAAEFPFRSVVGVELNEELAEEARRNLASTQQYRRARAVAVVCADAASYEPPQEPAVLYLNNPFGETTMAAFVEQVERSLRDRPRALDIVYRQPDHRGPLDRSTVLELAYEHDGYVRYRAVGSNRVT